MYGDCTALSWFIELDSHIKTDWDSIKSALTAYFGQTNQFLAEASLHRRRQDINEPVDVYAADMMQKLFKLGLKEPEK